MVISGTHRSYLTCGQVRNMPMVRTCKKNPLPEKNKKNKMVNEIRIKYLTEKPIQNCQKRTCPPNSHP
jgi:hypothetical protein